MDYTNFSQPWEEKTQVQTRIPKKANSRFLFAHNPENWELKVFDTYTTTTDGKKKKEKIPLLLPKGWTLLDPVKHDYMRVYPAHKGNYHTSKWIRLEKVGRRVIEHFDQDGFDQWRLSLMREGAINPPHPQIAGLRLIGMNRALSRLERDQHIPEVANRLKSKQEELRLTKKAIKRVEDLGVGAYNVR